MKHPERIIQINVVNWLRQKHPEIKFQANIPEQKSTIAWRMIQDRMGFRSGISDLFFPGGNEKYKGLWLELKTEDGKLATSQKLFLSDMIELGYDAKVAYGYDEAMHIICDFYNICFT